MRRFAALALIALTPSAARAWECNGTCSLDGDGCFENPATALTLRAGSGDFTSAERAMIDKAFDAWSASSGQYEGAAWEVTRSGYASNPSWGMG